MTLRDQTGAAALQRSQIVAALERAGEDGVSEADLIELGGLYWHNRLSELRRQGYVIGERSGIFELVVGPGVEGTAGHGDLCAPPKGDSSCADRPACGSLSPLRLFEPEPVSHWEADAA